jgi:hypothetical protein
MIKNTPSRLCITLEEVCSIILYRNICLSDTDETRSALLKLCLEGVTVDETLDSNVIADKLEGYTGSDISNVCRFVWNCFLFLDSKAIELVSTKTKRLGQTCYVFLQVKRRQRK